MRTRAGVYALARPCNKGESKDRRRTLPQAKIDLIYQEFSFLLFRRAFSRSFSLEDSRRRS